MTSDSFTTWLKVSITLFSVILILIGFLLGYLYNPSDGKVCTENPFTYGIEKINEVNNDEFICSCTSLSGKIDPFYFDENGVVKGLETKQFLENFP
ncbi:hypothetical protein LCGC14_1706150 [marine sediment metagenome]|uniref:Uncharacterized protein n=1 Tax=marine sediment metagenome TaxID=412755 RepID=A0A0F9HG75_9ZZZZ